MACYYINNGNYDYSLQNSHNQNEGKPGTTDGAKIQKAFKRKNGRRRRKEKTHIASEVTI